MHSANGMPVSVSVVNICLDAFTNHCLGMKVVVKINVEDAEGLGFRGGGRFFSEVMPFVLVECFDSSRLCFFPDLGYCAKLLKENANYLLIPPQSLLGRNS